MPNMPRKGERIPNKVARRSPNRNVYNTRQWKAIARKHKAMYPLCVECEAQGVITPSEVTDHIVPINQGGAVWSMDNMQSLCYRHHAKKSGHEAHGFAPGSREKKKFEK